MNLNFVGYNRIALLTNKAVISTNKEQKLRRTKDRNVRKVTPRCGTLAQPPVGKPTAGVLTATSEPSISTRTPDTSLCRHEVLGGDHNANY